jgi:diguanylate cyclase (GGDEF)-like protein
MAKSGHLNVSPLSWPNRYPCQLFLRAPCYSRNLFPETGHPYNKPVVVRPIASSRKWIALALPPVCLQALLSLLLPRGYTLTAIGDLLQNGLLLAATIAVARSIAKGEQRARFFWALMTLGFGMWLASQLLWTYFEVVLRHETPNPFVGDVVLFVHIVPMMAALAVQPQLRQESQSARLGSLDVALLLIGWLYLFLFLVIPWQYVHFDEAVYGRSFDILYLAEHLVFLSGLALVARRSVGPWRTIYAQFFGAASVYAFGSILAGIAIDFHTYYTGSFYDLPLIAAMTWFAGIGIAAPHILRDEAAKPVAREHGMWPARLAMLAVFLTPLMIAWAAFGPGAPQPIRTYRLLLTVGVMLIMGSLVFVKQHVLDRKLIRLLQESRQNLDEMVKLKDDLADKEKSLRWHGVELQRKNVELQQISFTDSLTEVWNRRFLEETLKGDAGRVLRDYQRTEGLSAARDDHRDLIFIMVDMDFFKRVNDDYGHTAGDELLKKVAERLSRMMRKSDVLVRWGGEEFMIMSRSADRAGTALFCSRILEMMADEPFELCKAVKVRKTCSIGWAPYPWCESAYEAISAEEVIELADMALYRAKSMGRNQSVGFLPSDAALAAGEKLSMEIVRQERSELIKAVRTHGPGKEDVSPAATATLNGVTGDIVS